MREKARVFLSCLILVCALSGCTKPEAPVESAPAAEAAEAGGASEAPSVLEEPKALSSVEESAPEEPVPMPAAVEDAPPQADAAVAKVAPSQAPQMAGRGSDGAIQVSDELYRDIVNRTLQTAWALQAGEPIFDGIEDMLSQSADYVLDIEGMPDNLERRGVFYENVKAGVADAILVIVLGTDEDAPVMVETYHYTGEGNEYAVEQIFADGGRIVRKTENRRAPE